MGRCAIVILSGGLGPTEDDVTREAVAQALGRELVFHADIAEAIERRFAAMKRKMSEINKRQAFVIAGAEVLPNDRGTAPGQWVAANGAVAMLLPGPPHELKAMFEQQCLPRLVRIAPKQAIRTAFLARHRHAGIGPRRAHFAGLQEVFEGRHHHSRGQWRSCRSTCAPAAVRKPRRRRCWRKSPAHRRDCWATGSIRAPAIRWKWWSETCCERVRRRWRWPKAAPEVC
jgi:hypothetical protein